MTGRVCKKSPPKMVVIPPKISSQLRRSRNVRSTALNANLCWAEHSSQIRREALCRTFASAEFFGMEQMQSSMMSKGILNVECAVFPPGSNLLRLDFTSLHRHIGLPRFLSFPFPPSKPMYDTIWSCSRVRYDLVSSPCAMQSGLVSVYDTIWSRFHVRYQSQSHAYYDTQY